MFGMVEKFVCLCDCERAIWWVHVCAVEWHSKVALCVDLFVAYQRPTSASASALGDMKDGREQ